MNNKYFLYCFLIILLYGCGNVKYLNEGELLYIGGEVDVEGEDISRGERKTMEGNMEGQLRPRPNTSFLGLRPQLWFYNIAGGEDASSGIGRWIRDNLGQPPVLFSQVDLEYNAELIQGYAENRGFFNARSIPDSTEKNRKVTAEYAVILGDRYYYKDISFPTDSIPLTVDIMETKERSFLKVGDPYDLGVIKDERVRIDANLKEKGYYFFNPDYLLAQIDSTAGDKEVSLNLVLKDVTPEPAKQQYRINNIYIYPDYTISGDTIPTDSPIGERFGDFVIFDPDNKFKPQLFKRSLQFESGELYNRTDHNKSINRLVNLGIFQFVSSQFKVSDTTENALDAYYFLSPMQKKSIRLELVGKTNSANYAGTEVNLSWRNRNTFRGAELLTISAFVGYETQVSGQNQGFDIFRIGGDASLTWPKLITPFNITSGSAFVPRTRAMLGYEYQARTRLYGLNSFKTSFEYLWKENIRKEHLLRVMDIVYVRPFNVSDMYREQIELNPNLGRIIEEQLIFGPSYVFTYTNTMQTTRKHTFYFQGNLDTSGNITGLLTGADIDSGEPETVFGVPFSQYLKAETDFRHYLKLGRGMDLASRIIVGAGLPYGNSRELPFIKQFFVGGTNSVRAFRARSVGPGTYNQEVEASSFLPDQSGDLKLELNTELRADLFSIVEGALFIDAGNIWLMNENPNKPGAEFSSDFIKELAVGTGFGLRFDLQFLILRTDLAFPIRIPHNPEGERWVFDQIDFGDKAWRRQNLIFNLAIGYPF
ncbi:BamA/TamA family outer membrane protein [soil metagenome]